MKGDDLVTEDVLASGKSLGHGNGPCVVLANHLDGSPLATLVAVSINLSPLEIGFGNGGDIAGVGSNVGDDGTHVRLRPGGPVELDGTTSSNLGQSIDRAISASSLVADDVGCVERIWGNEAVVEVLSIPANVLRDGAVALLGIVVVKLEATGVNTVDGDTVNSAVSSGGSSQSCDSAEGSNSLVHDDVCG